MYFQDNYKRYHEYRRYIFKESINAAQKSVLQQLSRPVVEFNILEVCVLISIQTFVCAGDQANLGCDWGFRWSPSSTPPDVEGGALASFETAASTLVVGCHVSMYALSY